VEASIIAEDEASMPVVLGKLQSPKLPLCVECGL
jgi:hypothetical protein